MGNLGSPEEWEELNRIGIKSLKKRSCYKHRFDIYANVISTLALIVSIASLILSIIALLK
ncbi:MAG: hypothetical protein HFI88_10060 [Lachnospiraceae bacterium]|nr:hypothetical protein [Lachnospiraceae bacterium]